MIPWLLLWCLSSSSWASSALTPLKTRAAPEPLRRIEGALRATQTRKVYWQFQRHLDGFVRIVADWHDSPAVSQVRLSKWSLRTQRFLREIEPTNPYSPELAKEANDSVLWLGMHGPNPVMAQHYENAIQSFRYAYRWHRKRKRW